MFTLLVCALFTLSSVAANDFNSTDEIIGEIQQIDGCDEDTLLESSNATDELQSSDFEDELQNTNSSEVLKASDEEVLSHDDSNESKLSTNYADAYIDSITTRYNSGKYLYFGWYGEFDGYFEVYKGKTLFYDEYLYGIDEDREWSLEDMSPGTYTAKLITYNGITLATGKIVIKKSSSKISVKSFKATAGTKFYCYAYVKDKYTGRNYNGGTVNFKINGKTYKAKLKNGVAVVKIKIPSKVKKYTCTATFSGGSNVYKSSTKFKMTVKKKPKAKVVTMSIKYKWVTKKVGKYTIKARLWKVYSGIIGYYNDVDIILYKNGKQLSPGKYLSKYKFKEKGKWKWWKTWRHGGVDHGYHRYTTSYPVNQIKIKFTPV